MKNLYLFFLTSLFSVSSYGQFINYGIIGKYQRAVSEDTLQNIKTLDDIVDYPEDWVKEYVSVEMAVACNEEIITVSSKDGKLTNEQVELLNLADTDTEVITTVKYYPDNNLTPEVKEMEFIFTKIPKQKAHFVSGKEGLESYLRENIHDVVPEEPDEIYVTFTIDEQGTVINTKLKKSSINPEIDKIVMDAIKNMPKWKPAINAAGKTVAQSFELMGGSYVGCVLRSGILDHED